MYYALQEYVLMTTDRMRRTTQNTAGNSKNRGSQFSSRHRPLTLRNLLCFCLGTLMLWFLWKTWSELSPPRDQIEKLKKEGNAKLVQEAAAAVMKELKKAKHETGSTTSDEISLQTKTEQKGCDPKSGLCLKGKLKTNTPFTQTKNYLDRDLDSNLDCYLDRDPDDVPLYTGHSLFNSTKCTTLLFIVQSLLHRNPPHI